MSDWQKLSNPDIQNFIHEHENADIRDLALKTSPNPAWPYPLILDQIKARQKAKIKIPEWLNHEEIIFPPADTLEQASSSATARYKANLFKGKTFADLTGGAGIDSWAMLKNFGHATIIDNNKNASSRIEYNMGVLGFKNKAIVHTADAEDFITSMDKTDLILIDPQRRDSSKKGLYALEDCSPNVLNLLSTLKEKSSTIVLKTSPMLDINQGIEKLGCVSHVHIIEWQGDCKEVLYIMTPSNQPDEIPITAVKLNGNDQATHSMTFTRQAEANAPIPLSEPLKYLYEPGPAFLKAGGFKSICAQYGVKKLHPHTHLYTSKTPIQDFPGRSFEILNIYPVQAKALPFDKINLSVRGFPMDVNTLKKKLKLKDGGDETLFACTLNNDKHALIHTKKQI